MPADRLVKHLGVDLSYLDIPVTEHLRQRLDGDIVGQYYRSGKGMSGDMETKSKSIRKQICAG